MQVVKPKGLGDNEGLKVLPPPLRRGHLDAVLTVGNPNFMESE